MRGEMRKPYSSSVPAALCVRCAQSYEPALDKNAHINARLQVPEIEALAAPLSSVYLVHGCQFDTMELQSQLLVT